VLNQEVLSQIYNGQISNWNDEKLKALNPGLNLPSLPIMPVYRSDGSGTTYNFTNYLQRVPSHTWTAGVGTSVQWSKKMQGLGGKGNEGVTGIVKRSKGSIGYVEYDYAIKNKLNWAKMVNQSGEVVPHVAEKERNDADKINQAFRTAVLAAVDFKNFGQKKNLELDLINSANKDAWPIVSATYILIQKNQADQKTRESLSDFFKFVFRKGSDDALNLNYIPIPLQNARVIGTQLKKSVQ